MIRGLGSACLQMRRRSSVGRSSKRVKEIAGMLMSRSGIFDMSYNQIK